jgi:hypothetical protein
VIKPFNYLYSLMPSGKQNDGSNPTLNLLF